MRPKSIAHRAAAAFFFVSLLAVAKPAKAPPVSVGAVETTPPERANLKPLLQEAVEHELSQQDFGRTKKKYVLSAALVTLDSTVGEKMITSTAVVSLVLRNQEQVLVASIKGSATAEDVRKNSAIAEKEAVRGAVRSAIGRVPKAVQATESKR